MSLFTVMESLCDLGKEKIRTLRRYIVCNNSEPELRSPRVLALPPTGLEIGSSPSSDRKVQSMISALPNSQSNDGDTRFYKV